MSCSRDIEPPPPTFDGASAEDDGLVPPVDPVGPVVVVDVGVAAAPETATVVEPPVPLCVMVTVADFVPDVAGWNATSSLQFAPTATVPTTQVLPAPSRKSDAFAPPIDTPLICSAALPVFVSVVLSPLDITPTFVIGKATAVLCSVAIGVAASTLVPANVMVFGDVAALLVIVKVPERVPAALGVKVTLIVHEAPAFTVPTQVLVDVNSGHLGQLGEIGSVSMPVTEEFRGGGYRELLRPTMKYPDMKYPNSFPGPRATPRSGDSHI